MRKNFSMVRTPKPVLRTLSILTAFGLFILSSMPASASPPYSVVAPAGQHVCALQTDGNLVCGAPSFSQRFLPPSDLSFFSALSAGKSHTCGIETDGGIVCWGDNSFGQLDVPVMDLPASAIDAGENHTCAIDVNGMPVCWGLPSNSRTEVPQAIIEQAAGQAFTQISTRSGYSCALDTAATPLCWTAMPALRYTQPPVGLTGVQQVEAYSDELDTRSLACAIDSAGDIQCWGERFARVIDAGNLPVFENAPYVDIAITDELICAVAQSGILDCQTHQSYRDATRALAAAPSGLDFVAVEDGYFGMLCALNSVGDASCWNRNGTVNYLQLEPMQLTAPSDFRASIYSSSFVELFWGGKRFADESFEIYRNDELIDTTNNESSYPDSDLETGVEYNYRIRSIRPDGSVSNFSNTITITLTEFVSAGPAEGYQPPSRAYETTGLRADVYWEDTVELFWDRQNTTVVGYEIRKNNVYLGFTDGVSFIDTGLQPGDNPHYSVIAVDRNGDILGFSGIDVQVGIEQCLL